MEIFSSNCLPKDISGDPFLFTMNSVKVAQIALRERIATGEIQSIEPAAQDPAKEKRYSMQQRF